MSITADMPGRKAHMDGFAALVMIFLTLVWGMNTVFIKLATTGFSPLAMTFLRAVIAVSVIYAWCLFRKIPIFSRDGSLSAGITAGALFGLEFIFIYAGLDLTSASRGTLMTSTMPFFLMIGAHYLLGEHLTLPKVIGSVIAFAGVALVFLDKLSLPSPNAIYGDILCLIGGMLWAATTLFIRKSRMSSLSPEKILLYQLAGAALIAVPLMPFAGPLLRNVTLIPVASVIYQAVFVVGFTYVLWFWLMARYPASGLSSFAFLSPVFGVMFSGLLLSEPITVNLLIGLAMIAAGLVLVNRKRRSNA
jgi:drug/metabolite transporter (DMT)-like permease